MSTTIQNLIYTLALIILPIVFTVITVLLWSLALYILGFVDSVTEASSNEIAAVFTIILYCIFLYIVANLIVAHEKR
jgi:hypothetical protein